MGGSAWTVIQGSARVQPISPAEATQALVLLLVLAGILGFAAWVFRGERRKSKYE